MIKINLIGDQKPAKSKKSSGAGIKMPGLGGNQNLLLGGILAVTLAVTGGWWYMVNSEMARWEKKHADADTELARLKPIRDKADRYEDRKELLERKISLITDLKKQQDVPVHILDQVSRSLPEFLWLSSMNAEANKISIQGKATTYNAVSNFFKNLSGSGYFADVTLGRTFEVPEGVSFSLTCRFAPRNSGDDSADQG